MTSSAVIKTIIAEAGGDPAAQAAVAAVIRNRMLETGQTAEQVVKQKGQFEGYSNPGSKSVAAQADPRVQETAQRVWDGIQFGAIPDPTNGATQFRAASAAGGLHAPNGTINIGGNVFAKGTAPTSALSAIDAIAPVPQQRPNDALAYASSLAPANVPLPRPRPDPVMSPPPLGQLPPLLAGVHTSPPQDEGFASLYPFGISERDYAPPSPTIFPASALNRTRDITVPLAPSLPRVDPRPPIPMPGRPASLSAQSVEAPMKNVSASPDSRDSMPPWITSSAPVPMPGRRSGLDAAQPSGLTSRSVHTVAIDPLTGNLSATEAPTLQQALGAKAAQMRASLTGSTPTVAQAGQVQMPSGVVPSVVPNLYQNISGAQKPAAPKPTNAWTGYQLPQLPTPPNVPPTVPYASGTVAMNKSQDRLSTELPPMAYGSSPTAPAVSAINSAVYTQPTTQYTYKQMQVANPAYEAYIKSQGADDIGSGIGSFGNLGNSLASANFAPAPLAPPKTITQSVKVPTTAAPQQKSNSVFGAGSGTPASVGLGYINAPNAAQALAIHKQLLAQQTG